MAHNQWRDNNLVARQKANEKLFLVLLVVLIAPRQNTPRCRCDARDQHDVARPPAMP